MQAVESSQERSIRIDDAWCLYNDGAKPEGFNFKLRTQLLRSLFARAPLMCFTIAPSSADRGAYDATTILVPRPPVADLPVWGRILCLVASKSGAETQLAISRITNLPLGKLYGMLDSQGKKVLTSALAMTVGKRLLARNPAASFSKIQRHQGAVQKGLDAMEGIVFSLVESIEEARQWHLGRVVTLTTLLRDLDVAGMSADAESARHQVSVHQRKADMRVHGTVAYVALLKRKLAKICSRLPELQRFGAGHPVPVYIKHPHFKDAVMALVDEFGARADSRR